MLRLEVNGLGVTFGATKVLSGVTFSALSGDVLAFMGPSGCGKTTLLRALLGTSGGDIVGTVKWINEEQSLMAPPKVGLGQQNAAGMPTWMNAKQYIRMCAAGTNQSRAEVERIARQLFVRFGLDWMRDHRKTRASLSGGMLARVSLAGALIGTRSVLMLDEPLASLDDILRYQVLDLIKSECANRRSLCLLVTHSSLEAFFLADRVIFLVDPTRGLIVERPGQRSDERDAMAFDIAESHNFRKEVRDAFRHRS